MRIILDKPCQQFQCFVLASFQLIPLSRVCSFKCNLLYFIIMFSGYMLTIGNAVNCSDLYCSGIPKKEPLRETVRFFLYIGGKSLQSKHFCAGNFQIAANRVTIPRDGKQRVFLSVRNGPVILSGSYASRFESVQQAEE